MMRRFLLTASVLLLFVSGWSHVLAASLCSYTQGAHTCCLTKKAGQGQASSHQGMAMDGMESMEMPSGEAAPTAGNESAGSFSKPVEDCAHCLGHSQSQTVTAAIITSDPLRRADEMPSSPATALSVQLNSDFSLPVTSRQHAPPGVTKSRHVLISVFRI